MKRMTESAVAYFGKVPSRGDFVRASGNHQLLGWLDRWAGESLDLLSNDPDWKKYYDTAPELSYAFLGSRSKTVVCGHYVSSQDASDRRFPLLSAVRLEAQEPLRFIGRSPMAMFNAWAGLARMCREARRAQQDAEINAALSQLDEARFHVSTEPQDYDESFQAFVDGTTLGELERRLRQAGHADLSLQRSLPALGLLLQPVLSSGDSTVDKALALPLVGDPAALPLVAAFWLDLLAGFLSRADFELAVAIRNNHAPIMLVGFNGADRRLLRAAVEPDQTDGFLIHLSDTGWVEDYLHNDYNLHRLGSFLERDDLALATAHRLFGETFLGT